MIILNIFYNYSMIFFNTLFIYLILKNIGNEELKIKEGSVYCLVSTLLIGTMFNLLFKKISFVPIIAILIYVIISKYLLKVSIYKSVLGVGLFYILSGIGEMIGYLLFVKKLGYSVNYVQDTLALNFLVQIAAYIIILILLTILRIYKKKSYKINLSSSSMAKKSTLFVCIALMIMMADFVCLKYSVLNDEYIIIMNAILMAVFIIISVVYAMVMQTLIIKNSENYELKRYIETIQQLTEELRRFKHNYRNILYGFSGYIENQEWDKLKVYYNDIVKESKKMNNTVFALQNITDGALFGLISQKYNKAKEMNIRLELNVLNKLDDLTVKTSDMCEVLGIYIDNAIEAASEVDDDGIVSIDILSDSSIIQFTIRNNYKIEPDLKLLYKEGYSTKDGKNRGIGLYLAKNILTKYDNVLYNTYIEKELFVQEIIINKKISE